MKQNVNRLMFIRNNRSKNRISFNFPIGSSYSVWPCFVDCPFV